MRLQAFFDTDPAVRFHMLAAIGALFLGAVQFSIRAGASFHRRPGYIWVSLMFVVMFSSFFISANPIIGQFSWINMLSVFTPIALVIGVIAARWGARRTHRSIMVNVFWFALVLTGIFTLLPGRVMHQVVFG